MTVQAPERPAAAAPAAPEPSASLAAPQVAPLRICIAAAAATAGAGWMAASLFRGIAPRLTVIAGAILGAGMVALSYRTRRPSLVQYLVAPVAVVVGALLVLPDARGGADLVSLVAEALRGGGLAQPPLPFDPGWRFVLIVLMAMLSAAAASMPIALARPKLAVAFPMPVVLGGALLAPPGGEATNAAVAIGFLLTGLAISYGAELAADGEGGAFERKRLIRGGALLVLLAVAMVAIGQARFLFPTTATDRVVPAQRPTASQVLPDRVLFEVRSNDVGPWRLGVLDSYDGEAWLLPSYDPGRLVDLPDDGSVNLPPATIATDRATSETVFSIGALEGHVLPVPPGAITIGRLGARVQLDPETRALRLPESSLRTGFEYTVVAVAPPSGRELSAAPSPPAWTGAYLEVPEAPNEVVAMLAKAPRNAWDRLQFARAALYRRVIAAGAGHAAEVPPVRVAELLRGTEATPYEITAAEALIARWAGIPARIGYGFYAGERATPTSAVATVRPLHGATWLEAYFEGFGWVPVVGVPPRARSSLSEDEKNPNANVRPSDELALTVHVPIELRSVKLLYVTVRYWTFVALGWLTGLLALWWALPGVFKVLRRMRRARWARAGGPRARISVAYAELRDAAADLGIEATVISPLGFVDALANDDEHAELAWLVTRALWGDLTRDTRDGDAIAAEEMARSVRQRLVRAQPFATRLLAIGSRTSLREPYSAEVPNLWPGWAHHGIRAHRARRRKARAAQRALGALLLLTLGACGGGAPSTRVNTLPTRLAPARIGAITFEREPRAERAYQLAGDASLVAQGRVFSVRDGDTIEASLQAVAFEPGIDARDLDVRRGLLGSIGGGRFTLQRAGAERFYVRDLPEQRILLWFTPDGGSMLLLDARRAFVEADATFGAILRYVQGIEDAPAGPEPLPYDPRRGAGA